MMDESTAERNVAYAEALFAKESDAQRWIGSELESRGLPLIQISALEGRLLALLARAVDARRVLEVGTLGGYSALWLLSLLHTEARVVTLERDPEAMALAREGIARAGEESRVELLEGDARETMAELAGEPPFDFVFIDADKESYPAYLEHAASLLRPDGLVAGDNAFWDGRAAGAEAAGQAAEGVYEPSGELQRGLGAADRGPGEEEGDASLRGIRTFNRMLAEDPRFEGVIVPVRDGLAVARFRG